MISENCILYFFGIRWSFSSQNNPKNLDLSLGLLRKGTTHFIAKSHRVDVAV